MLCFLGAVAAGLVPVPMYPPLGIGRLESYLNATAKIAPISGARMMVVSLGTQAMLRALRGRARALERVESTELVRDALPAVAPLGRPAPDDVLFLQFTPGSTSFRKGVRVTDVSAPANGAAIALTRGGDKV